MAYSQKVLSQNAYLNGNSSTEDGGLQAAVAGGMGQHSNVPVGLLGSTFAPSVEEEDEDEEEEGLQVLQGGSSSTSSSSSPGVTITPNTPIRGVTLPPSSSNSGGEGQAPASANVPKLRFEAYLRPPRSVATGEYRAKVLTAHVAVAMQLSQALNNPQLALERSSLLKKEATEELRRDLTRSHKSLQNRLDRDRMGQLNAQRDRMGIVHGRAITSIKSEHEQKLRRLEVIRLEALKKENLEQEAGAGASITTTTTATTTTTNNNNPSSTAVAAATDATPPPPPTTTTAAAAAAAAAATVTASASATATCAEGASTSKRGRDDSSDPNPNPTDKAAAATDTGGVDKAPRLH
jgi:hypothetical protein